jgi:hypothetical protein
MPLKELGRFGNRKMKRGRRSKLDPKLKTRICSLLAQGHTIKTVTETIGVSERTHYTWCEKHLHFSQATTLPDRKMQNRAREETAAVG